MIGYLGGLMLPAVAIGFYFVVFAVQVATGQPINVGDMKILGLVFAAGGVYMQHRKVIDEQKKITSKLNELPTRNDLDLKDMELRLWITNTFQTREACETNHENGHSFGKGAGK